MQKLSMVKSEDSVQVVSEPVSASAFFAYDFLKRQAKISMVIYFS